MGDVEGTDAVDRPPKPVAPRAAAKADGIVHRGTATRRGRGGSSADKGGAGTRREVTYHDCTFNISGITPEVACAILNANAPRKKPPPRRAKNLRAATMGATDGTDELFAQICDDLLRDAQDRSSPSHGAGASPPEQDIEKPSEPGIHKRRSSPASESLEADEVLASGTVCGNGEPPGTDSTGHANHS